jgi:hypothetical protein
VQSSAVSHCHRNSLDHLIDIEADGTFRLDRTPLGGELAMTKVKSCNPSSVIWRTELCAGEAYRPIIEQQSRGSI